MKVAIIRNNDLSVQQGVLVSEDPSEGETGNINPEFVNMRLHPVMAVLAVIIWGIIVIMNVAMVALLGMGKTS